MKRRIIPHLITAISLAIPLVATAKDKTIKFPKELLGNWEAEQYAPCKLPYTRDTETAILFKKHLLYRNEEIKKPLSVHQTSKRPKSWRIDLISNIDGYKSIETSILILDQYDRLKIANDNASYVYERCT